METLAGYDNKNIYWFDRILIRSNVQFDPVVQHRIVTASLV